MWIRWGTTQNFFLVFVDEFEKQIFITKNYWSGPIKNKIILIFTKLLFFLRNPPGDIIILHLCTKNLDDMIYSSSDAERDKLKLVFLGHFFPFILFKLPKIKILKIRKKLLGISSFYTCLPKNTIIWCQVPEIQSETNRIFCHFGLFLPFYSPPPLTTRKIKILKKWEKFLEISFYTFAP